MFYSNIAQGCACAFRKEVAEEYLQNGKDCRLPHDWALNLLAFSRGGLYYLKESLLDYRIHGENTIGALQAEDTVRFGAELAGFTASLTNWWFIPVAALCLAAGFFASYFMSKKEG